MQECTRYVQNPSSLYARSWNLQRWPDKKTNSSCSKSRRFNLSRPVQACDSLAWGRMLNTSSVIGRRQSMRTYCASLAHISTRGATCSSKGVNQLQFWPWTLCENMIWLTCVAEGRACSQRRGCVRAFIVTHSPHKSMDVTKLLHLKLPSEDDIYTLEICALSEFCTNGFQLWENRSTPYLFNCRFDLRKWNSFVHRAGAYRVYKSKRPTKVATIWGIGLNIAFLMLVCFALNKMRKFV